MQEVCKPHIDFKVTSVASEDTSGHGWFLGCKDLPNSVPHEQFTNSSRTVPTALATIRNLRIDVLAVIRYSECLVGTLLNLKVLQSKHVKT